LSEDAAESSTALLMARRDGDDADAAAADAGDGGGRAAAVLTPAVAELAALAHLLGRLRELVSGADPRHGVARMMHCAWFAEIILAFPRLSAIRVPLAPADDKTASLAGRYSLVLSVGGVHSGRTSVSQLGQLSLSSFLGR